MYVFIGTTSPLGLDLSLCLSSLTYKLIVIQPVWWLGSDSTDPKLALRLIENSLVVFQL